MQDLEALKSKGLPELREIAKALGISVTRMKKDELIDAIASSHPTLSATGAPNEGIATPTEGVTHEKKAGGRQRIKGDKQISSAV